MGASIDINFIKMIQIIILGILILWLCIAIVHDPKITKNSNGDWLVFYNSNKKHLIKTNNTYSRRYINLSQILRKIYEK